MNFWIHFFEFFLDFDFFYSFDDCIENVQMNDAQGRRTNQQEHSNEMKSVLF